VDLILEDGPRIHLVEMKSGQTLDGSWLEPLRSQREDLTDRPGITTLTATLLYGGDQAQMRQGVRVLPWHAIAKLGQD